MDENARTPLSRRNCSTRLRIHGSLTRLHERVVGTAPRPTQSTSDGHATTRQPYEHNLTASRAPPEPASVNNASESRVEGRPEALEDRLPAVSNPQDQMRRVEACVSAVPSQGVHLPANIHFEVGRRVRLQGIGFRPQWCVVKGSTCRQIPGFYRRWATGHSLV